MKFSVYYDKQPQKFLKKLDNHLVKRILDKIDQTLIANPVPSDAKTIAGKHGAFRIRIGKYRVLYRINYQENKIIIYKLDKRPRAY